jgi:O-antigen/teichoic acid export membrane protein
VRSSVLWNSSSVLVSHLIWLARSIVVARLLTPNDFGIWGMALTVLAAVTALTNVGLETSVILKKFSSEEEQGRYLDTVWTTGLFRTLLLTLALLLSAYPVAHFYGTNALYGVLLTLSFLPLVQGFQNIGLILLRKEVSFRRNSWFEQANNLSSTAIIVILALWLRDVRALVWGQLLGAAAGVLLSYVFHSYRPRLRFDKKAFSEAFHFGKYMFVIGLMTYLTTTADNIVVGRYLGAAALGAYVVAYNFANFPVNIISGTLNDVSLPAYAELRARNPEQLEEAFARVFTIGAALLTVISVTVMLLASEIVQLLYGSKWAAAAPVLRVLALLGFFRGYLQIVSPLIISLKGLAPETLPKVIETTIFLSILLPLTLKYGVVGAAWAGVIVYFITIVIRFRLASALAPKTIRKCLQVFLLTVMSGITGAGAGALVMTMTSEPLARFLAGGFASVIVTVGIMLWAIPNLGRLALNILHPRTT